MIEALAEGFFSVIGELIAYSLWPFFYYSGWVFLKVITAGFYPPKKDPMAFGGKPHSKGFVRFIGFIIWCVAAYLFFNYYVK